MKKHGDRKPKGVNSWVPGRVKIYFILILMVSALLSVYHFVPVQATFHDVETAGCSMAAGTWPSVTICRVCPCWGVSGACGWPLFVHGEGFECGATLQLAGGGKVVEAVKVWFINGSMVYGVFDLRGVEEGDYDVRILLPGGEQSVLSQGFTVKSPGCCGCGVGPSGRQAGESVCAVEKAVAGDNGDSLQVTLSGVTRDNIARAYAVAPGCLAQGTVTDAGGGCLTVMFVMRLEPGGVCDIVLMDRDERPTLVENVRPGEAEKPEEPAGDEDPGDAEKPEAPAEPFIKKVEHVAGSEAGTLLISGTGFGALRGESAVLFNAVPAVEYLRWSDTIIEVRIPEDTPSNIVVNVKTPGGITTGFYCQIM